jgi:alpha-1,2-mannosyltransferase
MHPDGLVTPALVASAPGLPLRPWAYLGLITIPLATFGLVVWFATRGVVLFGDVEWYATGMHGLLSDGPLYDPTKLGPHSLERPVFWDQTPSLALLTLLLALPLGEWIWALLMFGSVLAALVLIWPPVGPGGVVLLVPVLLIWVPVTNALAWGNVNGLVLLLLAIAIRFPRIAGFAIGIAAAAKLIPILAVAWLAGKRDYRGALIAIAIPLIATMIVVIWKGPETVTDFVTLRVNQWTPADGPARPGLASMLGLPNAVSYGLGLVLAVGAFRFASYGLSVVAMLVSLPALHIHYLTWLLPPLIVLWIPYFIRQRRRSSVVI